MTTPSPEFELNTKVGAKKTFPEFIVDIGRPYLMEPISDLWMLATLTKLGFTVGRKDFHSGVVPFQEACIWEVTYPEGWNLPDDVSNVYQKEHARMFHILDKSGYLRGVINCDQDDVPLEAHVYTRYCVKYTKYYVTHITEIGGVQLGLSAEGLSSQVVDRTKIDANKPHTIPEALYVPRHELLEARTNEERGIAIRRFKQKLKKEVARGEAPNPWVNDSTQWLDRNFPKWRDPVAYWPT